MGSKQNREYASFNKTLFMKTLNSGRVHPTLFPRRHFSSMYSSHGRIPQPKSNKMSMGHIETGPSTSANFVILSREYPKAPWLIWIPGQ